MEKQREFEFTERDFERLRKIVREHTGIHLSDAKRELVYSRLSRRLRALGMRSFDAYSELLGQGDQAEMTEFINAITTNLTSFFREPHHFDYLASTVLPALMAARSGARRLRIWSAGCSTGEEPYSLAIVLKEAMQAMSGWDVKILATDLDSNVIARAQRGVYQRERIEGLSKQRIQRWFRKGAGNNAGRVRVVPELQELITFRQLNLMHEWPMKGPFDIIFCRNVVIYFDKDTQRQLFERYAQVVADDGHLFIGHSETLFKVSDRFRLIGKTVYKRAA